MKVYTKVGDSGMTSIIGDKRTKDNVRIEAYGSVDTVLAHNGELLTLNQIPKKTRGELFIIINKLFDLNRVLATAEKTEYIIEEDITFLEEAIDYMDTKLEPLTNFILPIGSRVYTKLNLIRTLVRKAERNTVKLSNTEEINPLIIKYLNRLSDYFFVAGRYANYCNNKKEIIKEFE